MLTRRRFHGILGDFSLVLIAEELMRTAAQYAKEHEIKFDYYYLLSGQDYPLISINAMLKALQEVYPEPFIDCTPWSEDNWIGSGSKQCSWFFR